MNHLCAVSGTGQSVNSHDFITFLLYDCGSKVCIYTLVQVHCKHKTTSGCKCCVYFVIFTFQGQVISLTIQSYRIYNS